MKFENINDNTIKISLTFEDLSDHDVKLSDFFQNQQVIEQLFYDLVEELGLENRFNQTGLLTFQVQPHPKGVNLIVSEEVLGEDGTGEIPDDPEEFEELMKGFYNKLNENGSDMAAERGIKDFKPGLGAENATGNEDKKERDFIFYAIEFAQPMALFSAVKNVVFEEELSELFQFDDKFYLVVLDSIKAKGQLQIDAMRSRLLEYGQLSPYERDYLQEYGKCLIETNAMAILRKIKG